MANLDNALEKINRFVSFEEGDRKIYMDVLNDVTNFIIDSLKNKDDVFKSLYNGHYFQGSYMDNLKIKKPDEYDIILQLKLPKFGLAKIIPDLRKPGNVIIKITDILEEMPKYTGTQEAIFKRLKKFTADDDGNFLDQRKISSWFQSMFDNIFRINSKNIEINGKTYKIFRRESGPAQTIIVYDDLHKIKFSVDYVPGFAFQESQWVGDRQYHDDYDIWLAIPKPDKRCNHDKRSNISLRSSFSNTERKLIRSKNGLKNVCKLLKKLRDRQNIQNLKSYHIKTLFLWENKKQGNTFWNKPTSYLFMHMFKELIDCVQTGNLQFFWDKQQNMLADLNSKQVQTMAMQLNALYIKMNNLIHTTPIDDRLYKIFLMDDEYNALIRSETSVEYNEDLQTTSSSNDTLNYETPSNTGTFTAGLAALAIGAITAGALYFFGSRTTNRNQ